MKALIIEDNPELAQIYGFALQSLHYEAETIADGKKALKRIEEEGVPGLVILDMNLPQVSGHYLYTKLRADARYAAVPIIIATANAIVADAMRDQLTPMDHMLIKPISPSQLRKLIQSLFNESQQGPSDTPQNPAR